MKTDSRLTSVLVLIVLLSCPAFGSARAYIVTAAGDRLEFVAQAEKGYIIKLAEKAGGIHALDGISGLDAEDAREVRGVGRRGVWTVENEGPAGRNEDTIRSLRAAGQVAYAAPLFSSNGETVAIIPEIVARAKPGTEIELLKALCEKASCTIIKRMEFTEQEYLLEVLGPDAEAVFAALAELGQAPEIEWACPNTAFRPTLPTTAKPTSGGQLRIAAAEEDPNAAGVFPNDEYFPMQWHLHNTGQSGGTPGADIRAPEAWEITTGDPNIVVAVVDSGVDSNHPDLVNNVVPGYDFLDNDDQPTPSLDYWGNAHATACAGLIVAQGNNRTGVAGVTWNCKVMPIRVFSYQSDGTIVGWTEAERATAFRWAAAHGSDVVSNSWVWSTPMPIVHSAIVDCTRAGGIGRDGKGCIVLGASGNDNGGVSYPAKYPEVIAVGATDHNDKRSWYSNYGSELDITVPGSGGVAGIQQPF